MNLATPPTLTGNPGKPRDLQFRGPFLEMISLSFMHSPVCQGASCKILPYTAAARRAGRRIDH
jgi:hypothetical protein